MKEASGEFSMTLVVIVGAIAIIGILGYFTKDGGLIKTWIEKQWKGISCENWDAANGKCLD